MGGKLPVIGSIFSAPKAPAPPPPPPAPVVQDVSEQITEKRLKRQQAAGSASNVISNLTTSVSDQDVRSRISKLLG